MTGAKLRLRQFKRADLHLFLQPRFLKQKQKQRLGKTAHFSSRLLLILTNSATANIPLGGVAKFHPHAPHSVFRGRQSARGGGS